MKNSRARRQSAERSLAVTNEGKRNFLLNAAYAATVGVILWAVFRFVIPMFWPFLLGFVIAYFLKTIAAPLVERLRFQQRFAILWTAFVFYSLGGILCWVAGALLLGRLLEFAKLLPEFYAENLVPVILAVNDFMIEKLSSLSPQFAPAAEELFGAFSASTTDLITGLSTSLMLSVTDSVKKLPLYLIGFVFTIVSSFLIGLDYRRVSNFLISQIPRPFRDLIIDVKNFLVSCLFRLGRAYLIILLITFAELSIGLGFLRIQGYIQIAAVIAALDILPLIGSGLVLIPWGVYHLVCGDLPLGAGILMVYGVITMVRNIIEPKIVGDQLGLHPAATLAAMFFGIKVMGFGGILAAPILLLLIVYLNSTGRVRLYRTGPD